MSLRDHDSACVTGLLLLHVIEKGFPALHRPSPASLGAYSDYALINDTFLPSLSSLSLTDFSKAFWPVAAFDLTEERKQVVKRVTDGGDVASGSFCIVDRFLRAGRQMDRNGPCKSRWLGYFVDREVGAIW